MKIELRKFNELASFENNFLKTGWEAIGILEKLQNFLQIVFNTFRYSYESQSNLTQNKTK